VESKSWHWLEKELNNVFAKRIKDASGGLGCQIQGMIVESMLLERRVSRSKELKIAGKDQSDLKNAITMGLPV